MKTGSFGGSFLTTFSLISRVPHPFNYQTDFSRTALHMPIMGLVAAICILPLPFLLLNRVSPFFLAVTTLGIQYLLFNLFHFDGLLDSADALLPWGDREKRLRILKDSRIGAFAFFTGFLYLAAKLGAYEAWFSHIAAHAGAVGNAENSGNGGHTGGIGNILAAGQAVLLTATLFVSGRGAAALVPLRLSPAREEGLGRLLGNPPAIQPIGGLLISLTFLYGGTIGLQLPGGNGLVTFAASAVTCVGAPLVAALIAWALVHRWYGRKIGGFTGDALGLAVEIGELLCLLFQIGLMRIAYFS